MSGSRRAEAQLAGAFLAPAVLVVAGLAVVPILITGWEAMHRHDLRMPWLGMPFVGAGNVSEALRDPRFTAALLRTVGFVGVSVPIELVLGLALALVLHHATRGRSLLRVTALLPWAVPAVVAALAWRFIFDGQGWMIDWFAGAASAWVPIVVADVWKTTPFVAVLLLAGLQAIDPSLYDAARMDGASLARQFRTITVPLLAPTLVIAGAFRALDALRLFDLPYVMTGGGPGTATEPLSLYAYIAFMQRLRFGYGAALSMAVFALTLAAALAASWALRRASREGAP